MISLSKRKPWKWALEAVLAALSIAIILVLIEFFSPAARVYSQPLDLSFESPEEQRYTPEQRAEIEQQFDRKIEAVESGQLSSDLKRQRLHGPLLGLAIPLFIVGFFVVSWRAFLALFVIFTIPFFLLGFVLLVEVFLCLIAFGLGWLLAQKIKPFMREDSGHPQN